MNNYLNEQKLICNKYGVELYETPSYLRVAISVNVASGVNPVNGLRHPPEGNMTGWYIWAGQGEFENDPNFFNPVCLEHLPEIRPEIVKYLGLPPGWRFLVAKDYEDVWFDANLLNI